MAIRYMCKRSEKYNVVFADGVLQEVIDLINSKSKNLIFEKRDIVTSYNHSWITKLLCKIGDYKQPTRFGCTSL